MYPLILTIRRLIITSQYFLTDCQLNWLAGSCIINQLFFAETTHNWKCHVLNKLPLALQQLSYKSNNFKAFTAFIGLQKATKEKVPALQLKVDYIKSLFEVRNCGYNV